MNLNGLIEKLDTVDDFHKDFISNLRDMENHITNSFCYVDFYNIRDIQDFLRGEKTGKKYLFSDVNSDFAKCYDKCIYWVLEYYAIGMAKRQASVQAAINLFLYLFSGVDDKESIEKVAKECYDANVIVSKDIIDYIHNCYVSCRNNLNKSLFVNHKTLSDNYGDKVSENILTSNLIMLMYIKSNFKYHFSCYFNAEFMNSENEKEVISAVDALYAFKQKDKRIFDKYANDIVNMFRQGNKNGRKLFKLNRAFDMAYCKMVNCLLLYYNAFIINTTSPVYALPTNDGDNTVNNLYILSRGYYTTISLSDTLGEELNNSDEKISTYVFEDLKRHFTILKEKDIRAIISEISRLVDYIEENKDEFFVISDK